MSDEPDWIDLPNPIIVGKPCPTPPSHHFTPDVEAWAGKRAKARARLNAARSSKGLPPLPDNRELKAARQILATVGE